MFAKEELIKIIDGETNIRQDVIDALHKHKAQIKDTWPEELRTFIFKKMKEI